MKRLLIISLAAPLALLGAGCAADDGEAAAEAEARTETRLAAELRGFEPDGPPVSCVNLRSLGGNRSAGEGAIVFSGNTSSRLYVNRPAGGCPQMQFGRSLQVRTTSSQLCRGDIATVVEPSFGGDFGSCPLGDFEPYRRVR
jgi:hypothetical protein